MMQRRHGMAGKVSKPAPSGTPVEDVLEMAEIQGNGLAGFNKDHQIFLFAAIKDRVAAKHWLHEFVPTISTLAQVWSFNQDFRRQRARRSGDPAGLKATWINIALSAPGLIKLTSEAAVQGFSTTFLKGLMNSSATLGDPTSTASPGNPENWVVGGPKNAADVVVIIAADDPQELEETASKLRSSMFSAGPEASPFLLVFEQRGDTRTDLRGHEHFGFKDGISQPAPRGRVSNTPDAFLGDRLIDPSDKRSTMFAQPGQRLVWPGQFVIGYQQQNPHDPVQPLKAAIPTPGWAKNGSYVVIRRLNQDVPAFWRFFDATAKMLAKKPGFANISAERLASLLVGRWRSGAPVLRTPLTDDAPLGADKYANNSFSYENPAAPPKLKPSVGYEGDHFPQGPEDLLGVVCPHVAHIRKTNPRDLPTDTGGVNDTVARLIMRRGIPFGPAVSDPLQPTAAETAAERGLVFVSYQSSIKNQFEFLLNHWANVTNQPESGGPDPIIGQSEAADGVNRRTINLTGSNSESETIVVEAEWITPTGGGYFFSPSISAIRNVLSK
jgi:Dyp-type peroxidase family